MLLQKYTSDWVGDFTDLKNVISEALKGLDFLIEHVGSTSIPGLDAKNIIDIDIIYEKESEFAKIKVGLLKIGYYHSGNQGIEHREVFKRKEESSHLVLDKIAHHLYVCPINSKALERHLFSRDFMRKNDGARLEYQTMKYEIADRAGQDKKKYAELKELNVNDFIDSIIEKERAWILENQ
jgi:GrpB-like predicted nucleotidyltransferase (UPF0157 family)